MFDRDIRFLERTIGYRITRQRMDDQAYAYGIVAGSGPVTPLLFSQQHLATLALLANLFINPARADTSSPVPDSPRHPFTDSIMDLIMFLISTLPKEQQREIQAREQLNGIYLNVSPVVDYYDHREAMLSVSRAIAKRRQVTFLYHSPPHRVEVLDPYHIHYFDGHFYLIGYHPDLRDHREYRIDRIQQDSIVHLETTFATFRERKAIEFEYWADEALTKSGISERWLSQIPMYSEAYLLAGQPRMRTRIRATAYSEWRIIQQLHRYGDKIEIISPPHLRQRMRQELENALERYRSDDAQGENMEAN
jgi:hypothetical protein